MNASRPRHLSIRGVPPDLAVALDRERRRRGESLNRTVLELLAQGLGTAPAAPRSNGLRALAGGWTAREQKAFDEAVRRSAERVDEELWR